VILAAPTPTRYSLARMCLERGVAVLAERPLAATSEGLAAFRHLTERNSGTYCSASYQMAAAPHVGRLRDRLSRGDLGKLKSARAVALGSQMPVPTPGLWELDKSKSGGGCLMHFGAHALALLQAAVPDAAVPPAKVTGMLSSSFLPDIEDTVEASLEFPQGLRVELLCTWSLTDRHESFVEVHLELEGGRVRLGPSQWELRTASGSVEQDSDAPDLGGAPGAPELGMSGQRVLHRALARAALTTPGDGAVPRPSEALRLAMVTEETLHRIYRGCTFNSDSKAPDRVAHRAAEASP
jgi:predicted dehydrogenase